MQDVHCSFGIDIRLKKALVNLLSDIPLEYTKEDAVLVSENIKMPLLSYLYENILDTDNITARIAQIMCELFDNFTARKYPRFGGQIACNLFCVTSFSSSQVPMTQLVNIGVAERVPSSYLIPIINEAGALVNGASITPVKDSVARLEGEFNFRALPTGDIPTDMKHGRKVSYVTSNTTKTVN